MDISLKVFRASTLFRQIKMYIRLHLCKENGVTIVLEQDTFMTTRYLKRLLSAALIGMLYACVSSPFHQAPPLTKTTVVGEQQGYLVARVINAGNVALPFNHLYIAPSNLNESAEVKSTQVMAVNPASGDSSLFASAVDAGHYSLSFISSYHSNGSYWYSRGVKGGIELGTFEVVPGKVTDLGTLVYYPKNQGERFIETLLRSPSNENQALVSASLPFFNYQSDESLSWKEDEYGDDRRAAYNSALQNPVVFNRQYLAPDGSLFIIGKLGTILKRERGGDWSIDAVDTDSELSSIAQNARGDLALAGEYGSLFLKKRGQSWTRLTIDPAFSVEEVSFLNDSTLDVIIKGVYEFKVLRGNIDQDAVEWATLSTYAPKTGWTDTQGAPTFLGVTRRETDKMGRLMSYARTLTRDNKRYLFMGVQVGSRYHAFAQSKHEKLVVDSKNWSMAETKGFEGGIDSILDAGATELGIKRAGFWSWNGRDSYLRYDKEKSEWRDIETRIKRCQDGKDLISLSSCSSIPQKKNSLLAFSFLSIPVYFNENEALAFVRISQLDKNKDEPSVRILETQDGGDSWLLSDKKAPSKFCARTVPEVKDILLVNCEGVSSDFYASDDRGETWEHVRQHERF